MTMPNDRAPEATPLKQARVTPPRAGEAAFPAAREINARRAQLENPEMLRRLRSL